MAAMRVLRPVKLAADDGYAPAETPGSTGTICRSAVSW